MGRRPVGVVHGACRDGGGAGPALSVRLPALPARCRSTALAALAQLRGRRWIDRGTRAVSVHFALYNPPTRLLTSVSLRAEVRPAGGLALSSLVESVSVFRGDSARGHLHMLLEVSPRAPATRLCVECSSPPARPRACHSPTPHPDPAVPVTPPAARQAWAQVKRTPEGSQLVSEAGTRAQSTGCGHPGTRPKSCPEALAQAAISRDRAWEGQG